MPVEPGLLLPADCLARGANLAHETRVLRGRETGHIGPDLGDEFLGAGLANAGDFIELGHRAAKGAIASSIRLVRSSIWAVSASMRSSIMRSR